MTLSQTLIVALYLVIPVLSQDSCKVVSGDASFDFYELMKNQFTYVLVPNVEEYRSYQTAEETPVKNGEAYSSVFNGIKKDGTKVNTVYFINMADGATLHQTVLNNGVPTDTKVKLTFYAYKSQFYAQFYACFSNAPNQDLRFAVVFKGVKFDDNLKKEMLANDASLGFNNNLVTIGE